MKVKTFLYTSYLLLLLNGVVARSPAADFDTFMQPLLAEKCIKCHGDREVKGKVNFKQITTADQLLAKPELIHRMIGALDSNDMPPETEPALNESTRAQLLAGLKAMLSETTGAPRVQSVPIRRLNRFQYNNSVKDLFQLKRDVFELPEKLMTRNDNYLHSGTGKMPERVKVTSLAMNPRPGLSKVEAFPKDLRAAHGFDNQADQLTLSPLVLDACLRLSTSIIHSPDFNEQTVGIWKDFFQPPANDADPPAEVRRRLVPFLKIAFRGPINEEILNRYTTFATLKMKQGLSFTDSMKKVASAVLCSPLFLYRSHAVDGQDRQFALASNLSFFLWNSCPDLELLRLAESGELSRPEILNKTLERMFADPRIERFLDVFPSQWLQLENILGATPDPELNKFFSLDSNNPASLQMLLEPLLLFDCVFIEDRPIVELISPKFSYQSEFLKTWYTTDLKPPQVDTARIIEENRNNDQRRKRLNATIKATEAELDVLIRSGGDDSHTLSGKELSAGLTPGQKAGQDALSKTIERLNAELKLIPPHQDPAQAQQASERRFEEHIRNQMRTWTFERVAASDPRYGGVITNAAMLSMTSGPKRTHPIARGAWIIEVIFNDPPSPPPNDVPPLNEDKFRNDLTIRERFAMHRNNPSCAGCHSKLDPLGFALENYDITGRWRDKYENGREVNSSGTLLRKYDFDDIVRFKEALVKEKQRFAKAFTGHLLRFALARELLPLDSITIEKIVSNTEKEDFKLRALIREVVLSDGFLRSN